MLGSAYGTFVRTMGFMNVIKHMHAITNAIKEKYNRILRRSRKCRKVYRHTNLLNIRGEKYSVIV